VTESAPPGAAPPADPTADDFTRQWWSDSGSYFLTRGLIVRGLGVIDAVAFWASWRQMDGLIGSHGLLPSAQFLSRIRALLGTSAFVELPTLFWFGCSDTAMHALCLLGLALSLAAAAGFANAWTMTSIWVLYSSFVGIGQVFYGYGWELLTLEAGFLAIFLAPVSGIRVRSAARPPRVVVLLFRWLAFRVLFGAGLIKLRGDPCWIHLTCLADFYQTQPNPNPLSSYFHALPLGVHRMGALFNHVVELIAPWGLFAPRRVRHVSGVLIVVFQLTLILAGNLSFLNWLTIVVALSAFDDAFLERGLPRRLRARVHESVAKLGEGEGPSRARTVTLRVLAAVIAFLSIFPVVNLLSAGQAMNRAFDPLHLVNTYGAFGSVEHERHEVVLEGTRDDALAGDAHWVEYEFPCKPGDVNRRPCVASPYHYRLDWQMWFAGLSDAGHEPWIVKLVYDLLTDNPAVATLLAKDPFRGNPPRYVRALLYRYRFAPRAAKAYWERELIGEYLRPLSRDDAELVAFLRRRDFMPLE
jgi:hypothetical protein